MASSSMRAAAPFLLLFLVHCNAMVHTSIGLQEPMPLLRKGSLSKCYTNHGLPLIPQDRSANSVARLRGGASALQAGLSSEFVLKTVAPICGIIISWTMFAAPVPAVLKARKQGELGDVNPLPYPAQCGNCAAWLTYALLVGNPFIIAPNVLGLALGLFFTYTGLALTKGAQKAQLLKSFCTYAIVIVSAIVTERMGWVKHLIAGKDLIGWVGNVLLMVYYVSPLATLSNVIKTKNADSIDGNLAIAGFLNGMFWCIYGVAIWDGYVAIPNGLGAILALISSSCWLMFRK